MATSRRPPAQASSRSCELRFQLVSLTTIQLTISRVNGQRLNGKRTTRLQLVSTQRSLSGLNLHPLSLLSGNFAQKLVVPRQILSRYQIVESIQYRADFLQTRARV